MLWSDRYLCVMCEGYVNESHIIIYNLQLSNMVTRFSCPKVLWDKTVVYQAQIIQMGLLRGLNKSGAGVGSDYDGAWVI